MRILVVLDEAEHVASLWDSLNTLCRATCLQSLVYLHTIDRPPFSSSDWKIGNSAKIRQ